MEGLNKDSYEKISDQGSVIALTTQMDFKVVMKGEDKELACIPLSGYRR